MKARARTLVLAATLAAALVAVVAGALLLVERPDEAARRLHELRTRVLPFLPADVVAVDLSPRGAPDVRLVRSGGGWTLSPAGGAASVAAVEGLLDRLSGMRVRSTLPADPGALGPRGLEPPASRVEVTLRDGRVLALDLGDENPFDRTRFARRGAEILAVEGVPAAALDPAPDRLLAAPGGG